MATTLAVMVLLLVAASLVGGAPEGRVARGVAASVGLRRLQIAPAELNRILGRLKINLCAGPPLVPGASNGICFPHGNLNPVHTPAGVYYVSYWNVICEGFHVESLSVDVTQPNEHTVRLGVTVAGIALHCGSGTEPMIFEAHSDPSAVLIDGIASGTLLISSPADQHNTIQLSIDVQSQASSFAQGLPKIDNPGTDPCTAGKSPCLSTCHATHGSAQPGLNLLVESPHHNAMAAALLPILQGVLKDKIMDALSGDSGVMCKHLGSIVPDLLHDVIHEINPVLQPYVDEGYLGKTYAPEDVMAAERQLRSEVATGVVPALINLRNQPLLQLAMPKLAKLEHDINVPQLLHAVLPHSHIRSNGTLVTSDFLGLLGANSTIVIGGSGAIEVDIFVAEIRLGGLTTITHCDLFQLKGDYTVGSSLHFGSLSLDVDLILTIKPDASSGLVQVTDSTPIVERTTVRTAVQSPAVEVSGLVAVQESLYDVSLGDMLQNPIGCSVSKVFRTNVTQANATLRDIMQPTVDGIDAPDLAMVFNRINQAAFLMYEDVSEQLLPWITQKEVRSTLNNLQTEFLTNDQHSKCPRHEQAPPLTYVDFRSLMFQSINLTQQLRVLLDEDIAAQNINDAIRTLTKGSSGIPGVYRYSHMWGDSTVLESFPEQQNDWKVANPGKPLPKNLRGPGVCMTCSKIGSISIGIGNLSFVGLDTVVDFDLLRPIGQTVLANKLDASFAKLSIDVLFRAEGEEIHIDDSFTVHLQATNISVLLDVMAKIDQNRFFNLHLRRLADLRHLATTLAAVRAVAAAIRFETARVSIDCDAPKTCTSPMLKQMAKNLSETQSTLEGIVGVTTAINGVLESVLNGATTDQNVMRQLNLSIAEYANAVDPANPLSTEIARELRESQNATCNDFDGPMCRVWQSQGECEHNPHYMLQHCRESCKVCDQLVVDELPSFIQEVSKGVMLVVGICGVLTLCFWEQDRDGKNQGSVLPEDRPLMQRSRALSKEQMLLENKAESMSHGDNGYAKVDGNWDDTAEVAEHDSSLLRDQKNLNKCQRVGVPAALVLNILIFAYGHLQLGAQVDIDCNLAGDHLRLDRFVEFSLGHSLSDMAEAHTWALLIMVGTFSGIWPYAKLLAMLYCWCAKPGRCFTKTRRVKILAAMDYAGTWSLIDLYVLAMFILAFRLHASSPAADYVPENFYVFDVLVTPVEGLYAFIVGVCLSIVMNYVVLTLSRKTLRSDGEHSSDAMQDVRGRMTLRAVLKKSPAPVCKCHMFDRLVKDTRWLLVLAFVSIVMTVVGASRPCFEITVYGMIGAVVDLGNPGTSTNVFSLINSTLFIGAQGDLDLFAGPAGVWFIAAIYGSFCFLVPLAILLVSCVQLLCPMTLRDQKRAALLSEALRAWSALEVFIVAIYVTTLQLSLVSDMLLHEACRHQLARFVQNVVNPMIQYGLIDVSLFDMDPRVNECFVMEARHKDGIYLLIAAAALSSFTVRWISSLSEHAMNARLENSSLFEVEEHANEKFPKVPSLSRASTIELEMQDTSESQQKQELESMLQREPQPEPQYELQPKPQPEPEPEKLSEPEREVAAI